MKKLGALQRAHFVTGAGMHHLHHSGSCITASRIKYARRRFECMTAILGMPTSTGLPATRHTCSYHLYATAGAACWSVACRVDFLQDRGPDLVHVNECLCVVQRQLADV